MRIPISCLFLALVGCTDSSSNALRVHRGDSAPTAEYEFGLERLAPRESFLVVSTPDWSHIKELATRNTWTGLFGDETSRDIQRAIAEANAEDLGGNRRPDFTSDEFSGSALFFAQFGETIDEGTFAFLLESDSVASPIFWLWQLFQGYGYGDLEMEEEEVDGVKVQFFDQGRTCTAFHQQGGVHAMVFSSDREHARSATLGILKRSRGDLEHSVVKKGAFLSAKQERPAGTILSAFFDWTEMLQLIEWDSLRKDEVELMQVLEAPRYTWAAGDLVLGEREYLSLELRVPLAEDSLFDRLFRQGGGLPLELIDSLPAESLGIALLNLDLTAALDQLQSSLEQNLAEAADALRMGLEEMGAELKLDVRSELLDATTGKLALSVIPVPWRMPDFREYRSSMADLLTMQYAPMGLLQLRDPSEASATVDRIMAAIDPSANRFQYTEDEHEIFGLAVERGAIGLQWTFDSDQLVATTNSAGMARALRCLDGEEQIDRSNVEGMARALRGHADAFAAIAIKSDFLASMLGEALRSSFTRDQDAWSQVRWPSGYAYATRLQGFLVAALSYDDGEIRLTVRAR